MSTTLSVRGEKIRWIELRARGRVPALSFVLSLTLWCRTRPCPNSLAKSLKLLVSAYVNCSLCVVALRSSIHREGRFIHLLHGFYDTAWSTACIIMHVWSRTTWSSHSRKEMFHMQSRKTWKVVILCNMLYKPFSDRNDFVFWNDECKILKAFCKG